MKATRVTVVLGGGGAKAAAQIGALRALADCGLVPARYVGTSMGGVVAAAAAAGLPPGEMSARFSSVRRPDVARARALLPAVGIWLPSMLRPEPLAATLARLIPARRFSELQVPLTLTAVDLDNRELVLFGAGGRDVPLLDALAASTALPVYYPPHLIDGRRYADGGLRAVLPLDVAAGFAADLVIAIEVGPGLDDPEPAEPPGGPALVLAHDQSEAILMGQQARDAVQRWALTPGLPPLLHVRPPLPRHVTFAVERFAEFESTGWSSARDALSRAGYQAIGHA